MDIRKYLSFGASLLIMASLSSCGDSSKADPESPAAPSRPDVPSVSAPEKLGSYTFGNKEYGIYSAYFSVNDYNEILMFSPLRPEDKKTTYLQVAVHRELDGNKLDVTSYTQNYDYFLSYESPAVFYPVNIAPKSGTLYVKQVGDDEFDVVVDVILADGTPLKLTYNGVFSESPDSSAE